jgi:hypothetical protein
MNDPAFTGPSPQFGTAEYVGKPGSDHCQFCHQPIGGTYFRANGAMTCPGCADKMRGELAKDTHPAFVRAILFGVGAAVVGMILYATFAIVTGLVIGYAALAVGWIVGKAMIAGSRGVGGRRYQIAAVLLTYAAVSTAAIPIWIHYEREHKSALHRAQSSDAGASSTSSAAKPRPNIVLALGMLAGIGLASPFLELFSNPIGGLIGLVILFVGMKFAWRFTQGRQLDVMGPFENAPAR